MSHDGRSQSDNRVLPFPIRAIRRLPADIAAAASPPATGLNILKVGTVGLILFALATVLMTAVIPLVLLGAFLAWCGLMALLTAIDVIPDRLGLRKRHAPPLRGSLDQRAVG